MTGKERVLTSLEHREPDRVPLDLGSTPFTGVHKQAYAQLVGHLGLEVEIRVWDPLQQLAYVDDNVKERLQVDVTGVGGRDPSFWKSTIVDKGDGSKEYLDGWGITRVMGKDALYFDKVLPPLAGLHSEEGLESVKFPPPNDFLEVENLIAALRREREQERALVLVLDGETIGKAVLTVGFTNFYMSLARRPRVACALMDKVVDQKIAIWEMVLAKLDFPVDVVAEADDFGSQDRLLIAPDLYRKLMKPRQKRLFSFIKRHVPGAKLFYHCCGAIRPIIPDLIELGVDILNPVQVDAAGMDPQGLKREFGGELVFWGGAIRNAVLTNGSPAEVQEEVKRNLDALAPGGGYVFATIHNIQPEVPPENLMAMWEALERYARYS